MRQRRLNALLIIGSIGVFTVGSNVAVQLYRAFGQNKDIWWTARNMPLRLDEAKHRFEIFIKEESLDVYLSDSALYIKRDDETYDCIAASDISVRINNWYEVKSSLLAHSLFPSFLFGACFTMLTIGIVQVLGKSKVRT